MLSDDEFEGPAVQGPGLTIAERVEGVKAGLVNQLKSSKVYDKYWKMYSDICLDNGGDPDVYNAELLLLFMEFLKKEKKYAPNTLWCDFYGGVWCE
jgi:hypothetical protein